MISFFVRRAFLNVNPGNEFEYNGPPKRGHLMRVSSMIRGDQIASYLGAKLNPASGYENDVCIYVKPHKKRGEDFKFEGKPYMDIVDGWGLIGLMKNHPEVPVIACSQMDYESLQKALGNKIVLIPQQHCNFDRLVRTRNKITTVGVIGTKGAFAFLPDGLREGLTERGMELLEYSNFFTRQNIVDFYLKIDIQIVWRPYKMRLSNPLKLVNAASFGIPTIALREDYFKELDGYYLPVKTVGEFFTQLDSLRSDPDLYNTYSWQCVEKAEEYHIENIAKLYEKL
jgi:hypothetical protein